MDNYVKDGEESIDCPPPFPSELVDGVSVMLIKEGTKFRNILGHVEKQFKDEKCRRVIFKGVGDATAKCISCVEVFKRSVKEPFFQWNEVMFSRRTDTWKPTIEGLSNLLVHVDVPTIFILVSRDPFPEQYLSDSCQSSEVEVTGFTRQPQGQQRRAKPKLKRPSEGNKWRREPKKMAAGSGVQQSSKTRPVHVGGAET